MAAATEAAFCGILKFCGQLQSAAVAAATHGIFTLVCVISILKFVFSLIEESCELSAAAASVAALVSWKHGLVAAAASVGLLALVVCYQFLVDSLGSRFASVTGGRRDPPVLYFASVRRGYHFLEDIKFPSLCLGSWSFHGGGMGVWIRLIEGGGSWVGAGGMG